MKMGDVFCMAGFTAWQPNCSDSFKPPKGRVAVVLLLGDADKKNPDSFDPALALNQIGWHREDGELIEGLKRQVEELQKAVELHAGYHAKADRLDEVEKDLESHKRMLLGAATTIGSIGEALGLDMDDDADTMLGTIAANAQALRCNQEAGKILAASNKALFDDLVTAAETLRRYEGLHLAKGTDDSLKKAEVNAELASRFEATLAQAGHHQGLDIPDFTPGNGNKGRRRAAALGIDYDAAAKARKIKP